MNGKNEIPNWKTVVKTGHSIQMTWGDNNLLEYQLKFKGQLCWIECNFAQYKLISQFPFSLVITKDPCPTANK